MWLCGFNWVLETPPAHWTIGYSIFGSHRNIAEEDQLPALHYCFFFSQEMREFNETVSELCGCIPETGVSTDLSMQRWAEQFFAERLFVVRGHDCWCTISIVCDVCKAELCNMTALLRIVTIIGSLERLLNMWSSSKSWYIQYYTPGNITT